MPSDQTMKLRSDIHSQNVNKRGKVSKSLSKKGEDFKVGPVLLGVFLFVVIGSALIQILNVANSGYEL